MQQRRGSDWLRHTDSPATWWAGAALMHDEAPSHALPARIDAAEAFYGEHGAAARFQVCPACPPELDEALGLRDYRRSGDVSLQVARTSLVHRTPAEAVRVEVQEQPDRAWVDLLVRAQESRSDAAAEHRLLQRIDLPSAYVTAHIHGRPVAVGRAVADDGWAGVFGMATLPDGRRRGAGAAVLAALAGWAAGRACAGMYLQVTCDSPAALALYRRAGFVSEAGYHYRTAARG